MKFRLFIIVLIVASIHEIIAQETTDYLNEDIEIQKFDKEKWQRLSNDLDYSGDVKKPKKSESLQTAPTSKPFFSPFVLGVFKAILFILVIALLVWVLLLIILKSDFKNKKIKPQNLDFEKIEEDLENVELNPFLTKALQEGNYRLAIRIYYLMIIQSLSEKEKIKWRKDKTNAEYLNEMLNENSFSVFNKITLVFETVWYGLDQITKLEYEKLQPNFHDYFTQLNSIEPQENL